MALHAVVMLLSLLLVPCGQLSASGAEPIALFDGETLAGWEGDVEKTWRIEDGAIAAGSHEKAAPRNEFLSTRHEFQDFDLHLKFKIVGDIRLNAGVQFRTKRIPNHHEVSGYQADIGPGYYGGLYDESRRNRMLVTPDKAVVERALAAAPADGWNSYRIRAKGKRIQLWLNGVQTVDYAEPDESIPQTGVIALQIHGGMRGVISYTEIHLEELSPSADHAIDPLSPAAALAAFTVADGLAVKTFAADPDIVSISNIDIDHRGRIWACESVNYRSNNGKRPEGDRILILEDSDGDGAADKTTVFYQGRDIDIPMGICVLGNKAIVSVAPDILLLEDTDGDDRADKKTILLTSDADFQHDHSLHSYVFGPDGRFYANFGNTGRRLKDATGRTIVDRTGSEIADDGQPYQGGMVFRCDRNFENFEVLGHNFRNNYEAAVDSFGSVWQSDNDDDGNMGVRMNYILPGGNFGYRDELTRESWQLPRIGQHPSRGMRHWHQNDPGVVPNVIVLGNGSPTGVAVYEGELLPDAFRNQVLFCDAGPHVVWGLPVQPSGAGYTAERVDLIRSSDNNFRPVDVAVAPDGSVFVSDWFDPVVGGFQQRDIERGRIYWIAPPGSRYQPPEYDFESAEGAVAALRSPNLCVRYLAWTRLHELGADAEKPLLAMASDENPRMRARALWLLGQITGRAAATIEQAIQDENEDVRIVGLRLADLIGWDVIGVIEQLAEDASPRVRAECAVQLRHRHSPEAVASWAKLAARHPAGDRWHLEALGIGAAGKWDACLQALAKSGGAQSEEADRDIIWRSRGTNTPEDLARLVLDADGQEDVRRYIRAFDFQTEGSKEEALFSIAFGSGVHPEIALAALLRVDPSTELNRDAVRRRLVALIGPVPLDSNSLQAIKNYELLDLYPKLLETAQMSDNELRVDAVMALFDLQQDSSIISALASSKPEAMLATGRVLAESQHPPAIEMLLPFLISQSPPAAIRQEVARTLCNSERGAKELLEWIEAEKLTSDLVRQAVASSLLTHRDDDVRARAEGIFQLKPTKNSDALPKLAELIEMKGDAQRGRQVYLKSGQCAKCHKAGTDGKEIGPDLSQIGAKLARSAMFEAILYPNAAISHNYETYTAQLASGQSAAGLLVSQNGDEIQIRDAEGILRTFPRAEVDRFERSDVSLMPGNLHEQITTQELVDLVEYLMSLKQRQ